MSKRRVTIYLKEEVWGEFRADCLRSNVSASERVEGLIEKSMRGPVEDLVKNQKNMLPEFNKVVDKILDEEISKKPNERSSETPADRIRKKIKAPRDDDKVIADTQAKIDAIRKQRGIKNGYSKDFQIRK